MSKKSFLHLLWKTCVNCINKISVHIDSGQGSNPGHKMSIGPVETQSAGASSEKVPVSFVCSSSCAFVVSERPILVPITSTPSELSDLIRHLLAAEGEEIPEDASFDFLFEMAEDTKILIRGPLQKILLEAGWTLERTVRLEYFQSSPSPQLQATIDHPDWIRSLCSSPQGTFATGCYDGFVRVFARASDEKIAEVAAHELAVNAVAFIPGQMNRLATVSLDQSSHLFHQQDADFEATLDLAFPDDEAEALSCLAASKKGEFMAVAGAAGKISVFSARREEVPEDSLATPPRSVTAEPSKKKSRKFAEKVVLRKRRSRFVLEGAHAAPVTALLFDRTEYKTTGQPLLFSASLDGSIRAWDLQEQSFAFILSCDSAITALAQHPVNTKCLISAHVDGSVRFWNISEPLISSSALLPTTYFAGNAEIMTKRLRSLHRGWITAISCAPRNENLFATAGHDGAVHIWDARCPANSQPQPQFTLKEGNGLRDGEGSKVLALDWSIDGFLRFGGEDNKVYSYLTK
jgi:ribosome biogenesis protein YTM1